MSFKKIRIGGTFVLNNQAFMKVVPAKSLIRSTTIHDVVTRGDFFAVNLSTGELTVVTQNKFQLEGYVQGVK